MDKKTYLLICLLEECAEVQYAISKTLRFGLEDTKPRDSVTNQERIEKELADMQGVMALLNQECNVKFVIDQKDIQEKVKRVREYMQYSQKAGLLDI